MQVIVLTFLYWFFPCNLCGYVATCFPVLSMSLFLLKKYTSKLVALTQNIAS